MNITASAAEDRRHVFVISYGRTGSTLLMALLSNHPGVLVRGENCAMMRQLRSLYENLKKRYDADSSSTSDPFFGAHLFNEAFLLPWLRESVERFLQGDVRARASVLGFKEISFNDETTVEADIDFLAKVFPGALLVFNTRSPIEVAASEFNAQRPVDDFVRLNSLYEVLAVRFNGIVVDYQDLSTFGPQTQSVFERLQIAPDRDVVLATLGKQQGYVSRQAGARITRTPYYAHPAQRDDIEFVDIQSVTLFETGVIVVSGGIVAAREITRLDWSLEDASVRIVRTNNAVTSEYYSEDFDDPRYRKCGFVVEIALSDGGAGWGETVVHLFGRPLFSLMNLAELPVTDGNARKTRFNRLAHADQQRLHEALRISSGQNYVYKNAPKCGCTTIKRALWTAEMEFGSYEPARADWDNDVTLHNVGAETPFSDSFQMIGEKLVFTFIRNPYERLFSAYYDKCVFAPANGKKVPKRLERELGVGLREVSFEDFLAYVREQTDQERDPHWQSIAFVTAEDLLPSEFIGAIEKFEMDFLEVFSRILPGAKPHVVVSNSRRGGANYRPLSPNEARIVVSLYERDFQLYGYAFDYERRFEPPVVRGWRGAAMAQLDARETNGAPEATKVRNSAPDWARLSRREDLQFMDLQSAVRFSSGVVVLSGGIIANRRIAASDLSVEDARSWIVNYRGEVDTSYYASDFSEPGFERCGFALEVMTADIEDLVVNLFGRPLFELYNISSMPVVPG